jgi:hypothetical protein
MEDLPKTLELEARGDLKMCKTTCHIYEFQIHTKKTEDDA